MSPRPRLLIACVGRAFLGNDDFGSAVSSHLAARAPTDDVDVHDFGIRGLDLAYTLRSGYQAAVFVDGEGLDPIRVLDLARAMGPVPERIGVVRCSPRTPAAGAAERIVDRVESLTGTLIEELGPRARQHVW